MGPNLGSSFLACGPLSFLPPPGKAWSLSGQEGEGASSIQFHSQPSLTSLTQLSWMEGIGKQGHKGSPGLQLFWEQRAEAGLGSQVSS